MTIGDHYRDLTLTLAELRYLRSVVGTCIQKPPTASSDRARWRRIDAKLERAARRP